MGGGYSDLGETGKIWYVSIYSADLSRAKIVTMYYSDNGVATMNYWAKTGGVSIRCVQDY